MKPIIHAFLALAAVFGLIQSAYAATLSVQTVTFAGLN